jgi:uncharacterized membrane protein SpoIIM required for sporulation
MREVTFIKQNADNWKSFERILASKGKVDPDVLADLFIRLTDDLSYAQTFYPKSKTTTYLNGLTARVHRLIYRNKKEESGRLIHFWKWELPHLFYQHRVYILISFIIFVVSLALGLVSSAQDSHFARLILGNTYVSMTEENIANGNPLGVYAMHNGVVMFLSITFNNIFVAFRTFALGMLFSFGSAYIIMSNGIMLGAFEYIFLSHGLLQRSLLTVSIHGIIELTSIIIAGGAGILLGKSFLMPGSYTRIESFLAGARDGAKIVIGLIPLFIVAGFLESFVTRYTTMPLILNLLLLAALLSFIVWYVVLYPFSLNRRKPHGTALD